MATCILPLYERYIQCDLTLDDFEEVKRAATLDELNDLKKCVAEYERDGENSLFYKCVKNEIERRFRP